MHKDFAVAQAQYTPLGRSFEPVIQRLDALLMVTKSCRRSECHQPWKTLHPNSAVERLSDALRPQYDRFYQEQPRVGFSSCVLGHIISEKGPQNVHAWQADLYEGYPGTAHQQTFERNGYWSWWT